jgi:hypothetical protein
MSASHPNRHQNRAAATKPMDNGGVTGCEENMNRFNIALPMVDEPQEAVHLVTRSDWILEGSRVNLSKCRPARRSLVTRQQRVRVNLND